MSDGEFVVLICRGDERPTVYDTAEADLVLKVQPAARVSVLSTPGLEEKVRIRYPDHDGAILTTQSECGHRQRPPTGHELDTENMITRTCEECGRGIWWHVDHWEYVR